MASTAGLRGPLNGVLPVAPPVNSTNKDAKTPTIKQPTPKLKVLIRRLAPGLTDGEFMAVLGDEWKMGNGKVDWFVYKQGKDSKE